MIPIPPIEGLPNHTILLITSVGPFKLQIFLGNHISLIFLIFKEPYILVFLQKALLIILISFSQDVWLKILDTGIEYSGMARLPIIMYNVIKTHVNYHVSKFVDISCSHDLIFILLILLIFLIFFIYLSFLNAI